MKTIFFTAIIAFSGFLLFGCNSSRKMGSGPLKARLETKAMCMNYTFTLLEGSLDPSMVEASWTDESTKKTYTNAFGIANPCNFPDSIDAGEEFYFTVDSSGKRDCAVCMAYYPTPSRKLYLRVIPKP